ncbi:MAG: hypothetical protein K2K05_10975 [Muribaculaceae bacterium]|nr:hypothetical protein [Muribaculaceae bacterium]
MRKLLLVLSATSLVGGSVMQAQQLPNGDFGGAWVECNPWTTDPEAYPDNWNPAIDVLGTEPEGWCIANVMGMYLGSFFLGSTQVGFQEENGYNDSSAAKLVNSPNSLVATQIVPGYMTLGTTWSTAAGFDAHDKDGGTFGGVDYACTPDALALMYKRTHGVAAEDEEYPEVLKPEEPATVVAYLWKGTYKQADVPGNIAGVEATKVTMVNRERNILGMETAQGGEVTTEGDACLIAKINHSITGNAEDWTQLIVPFEYLSDATPESANVILAANDYFGPAEGVGRDNTLVVDDVKMVFYSRALGLSFAGMPLDGFDADRYMYYIPMDMPEQLPEELVKVDLMSPRAKWHMDIDRENSTVYIVVSNDGEDIDGEKSHVYAVKFKSETPEVPVAGVQYVGTLSIDVPGMESETLEDQTVVISNDPEKGVTVAIYNFMMGGAPIGDIIIENVTKEVSDNVTYYSGAVENLALMGGVINCSVDCKGSETADGHLVMDINVGWKMDESTVLPVSVKFDGWNSTSGISGVATDNSAAEYYNLNGVKVNADALVPGLYIRVQGGKASKTIIR